MTTSPDCSEREALWANQDKQYRDPAEVLAIGWGTEKTDPRLYEYRVTGTWWETLHDLEITLLLTREYEHLLLSLYVDNTEGPIVAMLGLPHPSGLAVDPARGVVHVAATRNPNQILDLKPVHGLMRRLDVQKHEPLDGNLLVPIRARFLPGCLYIHDLAMVGNELHANAVGQNAIVRLSKSGGYERAWWPKCIETAQGTIFEQNHLQLNSIAAGESLETSFFSASTDQVADLRPGDPTFPVDGRGVIFSGATRESVARGLTRPHSARFHAGRLWVDNSGYGEVGFIDGDKFRSVCRLPGWTRGLCFKGNVMFVGTSRVLPRFRSYAPGLDIESGHCGVYALNAETGQTMGSIIWPFGSQIFSVESLAASFSIGLPFRVCGDSDKTFEHSLFYSFELQDPLED